MHTLIFPFLNFALLIGFIIYKTKTPFIGFMKKRHSDVFEGLNKSKTQAAQAEMRRKEVEFKLVGLETEKKAITAEWSDRRTQQEKALQESSLRVIALMRAEAEQNKKALEVSLQADMLKNFRRTVMLQAETKIKSALTPEVHSQINQKFIQDVAKGVNA